ncbi:folate-binding protein [Synechococcales cyanobacterium C]|uniref:Folate-binding protein n=1 Tax=Petrachloros mirabilis ULC683 TaxID=2781853 RepID=A0A8K1ZWJ7_9CYAN|nr:folate-binding protein YgfZ [Petrachloros mirabilis]NCJ05431.1 folate-binding protein [Petrachloros mirabilis ULC683]
MQALREYQHNQGGHLRDEIADFPGVIHDFGNAEVAVAAVESGVAVCDRTHWGRLRLSGQDRLTFLHNQSSNDLKSRQPGQGCDTVILTSTARTVDLVSAYITEDAVLLLVSPQRRTHLMQWLDRYIFFGDKVTLDDLSETTTTFSVLGSESSHWLAQHFSGELPPTPGDHTLGQIGSSEVRVAAGSGLTTPGYTLFASVDQAVSLWSTLSDGGAVPLGEQVWEQLRIQQGRPKPDAELTEDYNPLEAGLWHTVSFHKGCYIGQETIARLQTYQGVKQHLWGIQLQGAASAGTVITLDGQKVGTLTSAVETPQGWIGLGYVKTKAGGAGTVVAIAETSGRLTEVPFLTRQPLDTSL